VAIAHDDGDDLYAAVRSELETRYRSQVTANTVEASRRWEINCHARIQIIYHVRRVQSRTWQQLVRTPRTSCWAIGTSNPYTCNWICKFEPITTMVSYIVLQLRGRSEALNPQMIKL